MLLLPVSELSTSTNSPRADHKTFKARRTADPSTILLYWQGRKLNCCTSAWAANRIYPNSDSLGPRQHFSALLSLASRCNMRTIPCSRKAHTLHFPVHSWVRSFLERKHHMLAMNLLRRKTQPEFWPAEYRRSSDGGSSIFKGCSRSCCGGYY